DAQKAEGELYALGLLDHPVDLAKAGQALVGEGVVGFYDPQKKDLVVRGTAITPYVRKTLAHELTHALDDQRFGLDRAGLEKANAESADGFRALSEGDAVHVEQAYANAMSPADRASTDAEQQRIGEGISSDIPE